MTRPGIAKTGFLPNSPPMASRGGSIMNDVTEIAGLHRYPLTVKLEESVP